MIRNFFTLAGYILISCFILFVRFMASVIAVIGVIGVLDKYNYYQNYIFFSVAITIISWGCLLKFIWTIGR